MLPLSTSLPQRGVITRRGRYTLTFTDGVDEQSFSVTYFNDSEVEPNETFAVVISNPSTGTSLGSRTRAHYTLVDPSNVDSMVDSENPGAPVINAPLRMRC